MSCCPPGAEPYLAAEHVAVGTVGEAAGTSFYQVGKSEAGLLLLPDVWGWNGGRIRALADEFARAGGLSVWVPKILEAYEGGTDGDGLPPDFDMSSRRGEIAPSNFQGPWAPSAVMAKVAQVVAAMRQSGVKRYGVLGLCWGGWIGFHLSKVTPGTELICGASAHPSVHLEGVIGGDPVKLASEANCPWALFPAGVAGADGGDPAMYDADGDLFESLASKFPGRNVTKRYATMRHGFLARGAIKDGNFKAGDGDAVQKAVVECVKDISEFFQRNSLWNAPPFVATELPPTATMPMPLPEVPVQEDIQSTEPMTNPQFEHLQWLCPKDRQVLCRSECAAALKEESKLLAEMHATILAHQRAVEHCRAASESDPTWFTLDVQDCHAKKVAFLRDVVEELEQNGSPSSRDVAAGFGDSLRGTIYSGYAQTAQATARAAAGLNEDGRVQAVAASARSALGSLVQAAEGVTSSVTASRTS